MKNLLKFLIWIFIAYLFISSLYILFHINFFEEPEFVGMGFSESNNVIRIFMGIPNTYSTYEGVSPWFLIEVVIKFVLAFILIKYLR